MSLSDVVNLVDTAALVVGLAFAVVQLRQYHAAKMRESALVLLQSYQTDSFNRALHLVFNAPSEIPTEDVPQLIEEDLDAFYTLMSTWESLGILLHRGEVSLDLVDDFFSGPIALSWRLFQGYVMDVRQRTGRETFYEWFQWLAGRVKEREAAQPPIPAYVEYRNWKPGK